MEIVGVEKPIENTEIGEWINLSERSKETQVVGIVNKQWFTHTFPPWL